MIRQIERIGAELETRALAEVNPPLQREVDLRKTVSADRVPSQIPLARRRQVKRFRVQPPGARRRCVPDPDRHAGYEIRSCDVVEAQAEGVVLADDIDREPGARAKEGTDC